MQLIKNKIRNQTSRLLTSSSLLLLLLNGNSGGCFRGLSSSNQNAIKPDPITIKPDQKEIKPTITSAPIVASSTPAVEKPVVHNQQQQEPNPNGHTPVVSDCNSGSSEPSAPLLVDDGRVDVVNHGSDVTVDSEPIQPDGHSSDTETVPFLVKVNECHTLPKTDGPEDVANDLPESHNVQDNTFDDPNQLDANGDDTEGPIYESLSLCNQPLEGNNQGGSCEDECAYEIPSVDEESIVSSVGMMSFMEFNEVKERNLWLNAEAVNARMLCIGALHLELKEIVDKVNAFMVNHSGCKDRLEEEDKNGLRRVKPWVTDLITQVDLFYFRSKREIGDDPLATISLEIEEKVSQEAEEIRQKLKVFVEQFGALQVRIGERLLLPQKKSVGNGPKKVLKNFGKKIKSFTQSKSSKTNLK